MVVHTARLLGSCDHSRTRVTVTMASPMRAREGALSALPFPKVTPLGTGTDRGAEELTPQGQTSTHSVWE